MVAARAFSQRPRRGSHVAPSELRSDPLDLELRRGGFRQHDDTELSSRCEYANRAERIAILSWFALLAWTLLVFGVIIALRAV